MTTDSGHDPMHSSIDRRPRLGGATQGSYHTPPLPRVWAARCRQIGQGQAWDAPCAGERAGQVGTRLAVQPTGRLRREVESSRGDDSVG